MITTAIHPRVTLSLNPSKRKRSSKTHCTSNHADSTVVLAAKIATFMNHDLDVKISVTALSNTKPQTPRAVPTKQSVQRQGVDLTSTPMTININIVIMTIRKMISIREGFTLFCPCHLLTSEYRLLQYDYKVLQLATSAFAARSLKTPVI